jgi:hypothetical protein
LIQNCSNPFCCCCATHQVSNNRTTREVKKEGKPSDAHLEDLETEDVEHTDHVVVVIAGTALLLKGLVHLAHDPIEHPAVDRLGQGIPGGRGLLDVLRHIVGRHLLGTGTTSVEDAE